MVEGAEGVNWKKLIAVILISAKVTFLDSLIAKERRVQLNYANYIIIR